MTTTTTTSPAYATPRLLHMYGVEGNPCRSLKSKKLDGRDATQKHLLLGVVNVQPLTKEPLVGSQGQQRRGRTSARWHNKFNLLSGHCQQQIANAHTPAHNTDLHVENWAEWKWKCCSAMCIPPHARARDPVISRYPVRNTMKLKHLIFQHAA